jgi:diketogulonate reductase-like aldo/keto reductase
MVLKLVASTGSANAVAQGVPPSPKPANSLLTRSFPSSSEQIPTVGLGSWITFTVGNDRADSAQCADVMREFFSAGGRLIEGSPMYGSSQGVIGDGLQQLVAQPKVFSAEKAWTSSPGATQIEETWQLWRVPAFDLIQVHNLPAGKSSYRCCNA